MALIRTSGGTTSQVLHSAVLRFDFGGSWQKTVHSCDYNDGTIDYKDYGPAVQPSITNIDGVAIVGNSGANSFTCTPSKKCAVVRADTGVLVKDVNDADLGTPFTFDGAAILIIFK